jgi:hypothetical protein
MAPESHVFELAENKYTPYTEVELDALAFSILNKLERPYFIAKSGYSLTEERFGDIVDYDDPYLAVEFNPDNEDHKNRAINSSIRPHLDLISKFSEGIELSASEDEFLHKGLQLCQEFGDFGIEAIYPLATFLYLSPDNLINTDYITDHSVDIPKLKTMLVKFFTYFQMKYELRDFEYDFALINYLGIDNRGFNFKQLALLLGYETERSARILAAPSTPIEKLVKTFKPENGSNRTFIMKEDFIAYIHKFTQPRMIKQKEGKMTAMIKLTGGNVRNNHVYLTKVMDMFPDKFVGGSNKSLLAKETLKLDVGKGKAFETDIAGDKKIFRSREALKAFFENYAVVEGDYLSLTTSGNGIYSLRPAE